MSDDNLKDLLAKRAQLDSEISAYRRVHRLDVIGTIVQLMREFDIGLKDIEVLILRGQGSSSIKKKKLSPKFRDPQTGATWAGRGKRPRWMKGRDPAEFEIKPGELNSTGLGGIHGVPNISNVEPRYVDPRTGATWSGRGRRPHWLKGRD
jgi:DNA-binding protein H-NS